MQVKFNYKVFFQKYTITYRWNIRINISQVSNDIY